MRNSRLFLVLLPLLVNACSAGDFRKSIGIERPSPDEFMVQPREKLKIPDQAVTLPAPQAPIDEALKARQSGRQALYGEDAKNDKPATESEKALLAKADAEKSSDKIRKKVEKDYRHKTGVFGTTRGSTAEAILDPFGYNAPHDPVVDAKKENARIKEALKKGEKIDPDKVESKEPVKDRMKKEGVF